MIKKFLGIACLIFSISKGMDDTQINHDSVKNLESWNQYLQEPLALIPNANSRYAFINLALQPKLIIKVRINNISKNEENKSGAFKQAALVYKVMYSNLEKFNKAHSLKINDDNNKSAHDDNKITIESIIENVEHDYSDFSKEYYEPKTYVKANYNFKFDFPLTEKQFKLTKNPKAFDIKSEYITDNYFNKREKHTEDLFSYILSKINADSITSKITFDTHTAKKIYIGNLDSFIENDGKIIRTITKPLNPEKSIGKKSLTDIPPKPQQLPKSSKLLRNLIYSACTLAALYGIYKTIPQKNRLLRKIYNYVLPPKKILVYN